jgi:hypothetical protein
MKIQNGNLIRIIMNIDFNNPRDPRNYDTFSESPHYIHKGGGISKTDALYSKEQCAPFTSREKKIFKITGVAFVILLILSIFIFSLSTTFSIVAALMPLLIFGVLIPYLTIREIIFYVRNYFSRKKTTLKSDH